MYAYNVVSRLIATVCSLLVGIIRVLRICDLWFPNNAFSSLALIFLHLNCVLFVGDIKFL